MWLEIRRLQQCILNGLFRSVVWVVLKKKKRFFFSLWQSFVKFYLCCRMRRLKPNIVRENTKAFLRETKLIYTFRRSLEMCNLYGDHVFHVVITLDNDQCSSHWDYNNSNRSNGVKCYIVFFRLHDFNFLPFTSVVRVLHGVYQNGGDWRSAIANNIPR